MRGLPYSGKSARARELAGDIGRIHSANDYFMVDGVYRYDVRQIRNAHSETQAAFRKDLEESVPIVICDNCNVRAWEIYEYVRLASSFGYEIEIVTMPHYPAIAAFRKTNWREIPTDKFLKMHDSFENYNMTKVLTDH
jgi:predicted kinase